MMEDEAPVNREKHKRRLQALPSDLAAKCRHIAEDLRNHNTNIRDEKILTARVRMCSGFYDSDDAIRLIATRLISESTAKPDGFLAG
jgi:hypothetical protein